jgi:site-specific DNA-cytosine methylase
VRGRQVGLLWASPDCTHFSRAKGGKPRSQKIRGLAWVVVDWAAAVAPRVIALENVPEFVTWGPLDDEGQPIEARRRDLRRVQGAAARARLRGRAPRAVRCRLRRADDAPSACSWSRVATACRSPGRSRRTAGTLAAVPHGG